MVSAFMRSAPAPDEAALTKGRERVRRDIGFYGSTPAYQPVLELHGLGDLAKNLNKLVRNGDWDKSRRPNTR